MPKETTLKETSNEYYRAELKGKEHHATCEASANDLYPRASGCAAELILQILRSQTEKERLESFRRRPRMLSPTQVFPAFGSAAGEYN